MLKGSHILDCRTLLTKRLYAPFNLLSFIYVFKHLFNPLSEPRHSLEDHNRVLRHSRSYSSFVVVIEVVLDVPLDPLQRGPSEEGRDPKDLFRVRSEPCHVEPDVQVHLHEEVFELGAFPMEGVRQLNLQFLIDDSYSRGSIHSLTLG